MCRMFRGNFGGEVTVSDKVKLPREVAEAIKEVSKNAAGLECLYDIPYMIRCVDKELPDSYAFEMIVKFYQLKNKNKVDYFQALVNGYEVEASPEERAVEWLMEQEIIHRDSAEKWVRGIKNILEGKEA